MKFCLALTGALVLMLAAACTDESAAPETTAPETTAPETTAEETVPVTLEDTTSLHVDLDAVVKFESVTPVAGLTSAGQPSEQGLQIFSDNGYSAIIDLRGPDEKRGFEERQAVVALGMEYVSLPIDSENDINYESAAVLAELIESYDGPVLVHCASGNRVGALLALQKAHEGADIEVAIAYGKEGGMTRLEKHVREQLQTK